MSSLILVLVGLAMMAAGYLLYSRFLGQRVYQLSDAYTTPAHTMEDGVDFVPTNKYVLWGHHFTSVAGAAMKAKDLEARLVDFGQATGLGSQVLEDAICNWQKSPDRYDRFRG